MLNRSFLFIVILFAVFASCTPIQDPEFRDIENLNVQMQGGNVLLTADAIMFNPNNRKMTLYEIDMDIIVNDKAQGKVKDTVEVPISPNDEFKVPLSVSFAASDILGNVLSSLFSNSKDKTVKVQYKGFVRVKALGFKFKLPVNSKKEIKLGF